jgi:C-terminal processing protease CtpA/Prc
MGGRAEPVASFWAATCSLAGFAIALCSACATPHGTIGAVLTQRNDGMLVVRDAPTGLAAERGGVRAGDEVLLIEGRDVRALSAEAVHRALSGEVGEPVKLTLVRDERIVRVTLLRSAPPASGKGESRQRRLD